MTTVLQICTQDVFGVCCLQALVDGPCSGVARKAVPFKRMHLTKFVVKVPHSARTAVVKKAWEKANISSLWEETTWAKKLAAKQKVTQPLWPSLVILLISLIIFVTNDETGSAV